MSSLAYDHNMARVTHLEDGRAEVAYDLEHDRWPWLSLPPQHPVLLEKFQYFGSLTAMWALKLFDPEVQTALTGFEWECPQVPLDTGLPVRGLCENRPDAPRSFDLSLEAANGHTLMTSTGHGVAFATRDFAGWREQMRQQVLDGYAKTQEETQRRRREPLVMAPTSAVGLPEDGVALVTPLRQDDGVVRSTALVTLENGFPPHHPFHTGSGDHVNVGHLFDCVLQVAHLVLDASAPLHCVAGFARFARYTELGVPFDIRLESRSSGEAGERLVFAVSQLGQDTSTVSFTMKR